MLAFTLMSQGLAAAWPIALAEEVRLRPAGAVDHGTHDLEVVARAELRLLPRPGLALVAEDGPLPGHSVETWALIEPRVAGAAFTLVAGLFRPCSQPLVVERQRDPARRLAFEVLNFPKLGGGHVSLEAGPWKIEVTEKRELRAITSELNSSHGFAPTHEGRIEKIDGAPIEQDEACQLVEALDRFLSFARGFHCATAGVRGISSEGAVVWEHWGCRRVAPWRPPENSPDSWFHEDHAQALAKAIPPFLRTWKACADGRAALRTAIYWYLTGHGDSSGVEGGLILLQTAMEHLAHTFFRPRKKRETGAEWLRKALQRAGVPLAVPKDMNALGAFVAALPCPTDENKDAVFAVTRARNNAVHPAKDAEAGSRVYLEAWTLARWFVELMVLHAIGYKGSYLNRLHRGVEPVPWA